MYKKILLLFLVFFIPKVTFAYITEVSCWSNSKFASDCNQCFRQTENVYLWSWYGSMSDYWYPWSTWDYVYPDENTSPVNIRAFYRNGELEQLGSWFHWADSLRDWNANNWEIYRDWKWDLFIKFLANTSWKIIESNYGFFMKFAKLTQSVKNNWRNYPLWETQYTFNYYNIGSWSTIRHKECVLYFPAYCWDWVKDNWETCDDWNNTDWDGCSSTCTKELPKPLNVCESWWVNWKQNFTIISTTTWLCKAWKIVWNFKAIPNWNNINYSWTCNWISGWNCNAYYTKWSNDVCRVWYTHNTQSSTINSSTPWLCTTWYVVTDFISTTIWKTINYTWWCSGIKGWDCNANYNSDNSNDCNAWVSWVQTTAISSSTPKLCANSWESVVNFIPTTSWDITNYTWWCKDTSNVIHSGWNCNASYDDWGSWDQCRAWSTHGSQTSTISSSTSWLCESWYTVTNFKPTTSWKTTYYTWGCKDSANVVYTGWNCNATYTETTPSSSSSWSSSSSGWSSSSWGWSSGWGTRNDCWDWIVQRPNDDLQLEECDFGSNSRPSWCTADCKIIGIESIPKDRDIVLWTAWKVVIWDSMNPYTSYSNITPYVQNNSDSDIYLNQLCVKKTSWNNLVLTWFDSENKFCRTIWDNWILRKWTTYSLSVIPNVKWNIAWMTTSSATNILKTTLNWKWQTWENSPFLSRTLQVEVSRPAVRTTGWWTSYIKQKSGKKIADVEKVANAVWEWENKNFVWVWAAWDLTSYTKEVSQGNTEKAVDNSADYEKKVEVETTDTSTNPIKINLSDFESYKWKTNAYVLKNANFEINSDLFTNVSWPRTYIIENWDLLINTNIDYDYNVAFVVKWWNIIIWDNVTKITWTYIVIWWKIKWVNNTVKKLIVSGSLYWDASDLNTRRTYVKLNSNWQLDVWTIVSFGSSVFRKPAPLTSTFINEYKESVKVAQ